MKKELIIAAATILIISTPAFAVSSHSNSGKSDEQHGNTTSQTQVQNNSNQGENDNHGQFLGTSDEVNPSVTPSVTPSVSPTVTPSVTPADNKDDDISGLEDSISGTPCDPQKVWKNHGEFVSCVAKLHLGGKVTSEAAKTEIGKKDHDQDSTPSATPTINPSVSPTPPISSDVQTLGQTTSPLAKIGGIFQRIVDFLSHLL